MKNFIAQHSEGSGYLKNKGGEMRLNKILFKFSVTLLVAIFSMSQLVSATPFVNDLRMARTPETGSKSTVDQSFQVASIPENTTGDPFARIQEIEQLLQEIGKEKQEPGSGKLPEIVVISDYHGEINLFLQYIADAISQKIGKKVALGHKAFPEKSIDKQLKEQDVDIKEVGLTFNLLGDFLDRGAYGIKCYRVAEELIDLRVAKYVTGNHDLWAFLNVMGFHLPTYKGYNFYGHTKSENLVKRHSKEHKYDISWWTEKLAEYNTAQKELQDGALRVEKQDVFIKDIRAELKEIYLNAKGQFNEAEQKLWEDLIGFYFGSTDVYAGFNAVGMMSTQWWQERYRKVARIAQEAKSGGAAAMEIAIWEKLESYTKAASGIVGQRLNKATTREKKWYWRVLNDINHQNYASVEWWGKDWSSHKGWGTAVIAELNELDGKEKWNQSNYINNSHLKDLAMFYRKHFTLFQKDAYGNVYTHGWLPVDMKTGQISFTYKDVTYEGINIWEGLGVIQNDVRDLDKPLSEIHEALSLVNSWYGDKTTKIKPKHIGDYVHKVGLEKIHNNIGVRAWFTCHNPLNKLHPEGVGFKVQHDDHAHFSVDKGMSWKKFKDAGGYVIVNANGVMLRGFASPKFKKIINSPPGMKIEKGKGDDVGYTVKASWKNEPLNRDDFLRIVKRQLKEDLDRLKLSPAISVPELLENIKGVLEFTSAGKLQIMDEARLRSETIDYLARECALNENQDVKDSAKYIIRETALRLGIKPASLHDFYMARNKGMWSNLTNPTFNLRAGVYAEARQIFRVVMEKVIRMFGFELARTETRYTGQRPGEYMAECMAAGIKEGYTGPIFGIGDHYQVKKDKYFAGGEAREKELADVKAMIREAMLDGKLNFDLDPSTLVDEEALDKIVTFEKEFVDAYLEKNPTLSKGLDEAGIKALRHQLVDEIKLLPKQERELNALYQEMHVTTTKVTMELIRYIRGLEKELLGGKVTVGIGIEERHIDNPKHKKNPSTVRGTFTLAQNIIKLCKKEGLAQPCKIALQTGTMHGVGGKIDFGIFKRHLKAAKKIGIFVFVQHGTSTIKDREDFKRLPEEGVGEAHLATEYQKIHLGIIATEMPDLAEKMGSFMESLMDESETYDKKFRNKWNAAFNSEIQEGKTQHEILVEILSDTLPDKVTELSDGKSLKGSLKDLAKEIAGPFKNEIWNVPTDVDRKVAQALYKEFSEIMGMLGVANTKDLVESIIPTESLPEMHGPQPEALKQAIAQSPAISVPELLENIKGVLEFTSAGKLQIMDEARLRSETIDYLARECALNENQDVKDSAKYIIRETALRLGIKPASLHDFYMARNKGMWSNLTNPTFNLRAGVYAEARQIFRVVMEKVIRMFGFELARTETRYTGQRPGEYMAECMAAGIKEGYTGPIFGIGDHYQVKKDKYFAGGEAREKELADVKAMIREAMLDGKLNFDLDPSTLVDEEALDKIVTFEKEFVDAYLEKNPTLSKGLDEAGIKALRHQLVDEIKLLPKQERELNALYQEMHVTTTKVTMELIRYIRGLEKELLGGKVTVGIGIEERHIDNPKHKKNPSTVRGTFTLAQNIIKLCKKEGLAQPCKIALQTGTMHGVGGKIDFGIFKRHLKAAKKIGIFVFVQHGTSTIKDREDFKRLPEEGVGEAHLATEYQKIHLGIIATEMPDLAEKMGSFMESLMDESETYDKKFRNKWNAAFNSEIQEGKTQHEILVEILSDTLPDKVTELSDGKSLKGSLKDLAKEIAGPFKNEIWNVPTDVDRKVAQALYKEFSEIMGMLGVANTKDLVESIIPTESLPEMHGPQPEALKQAIARRSMAKLAKPGTRKGSIYDAVSYLIRSGVTAGSTITKRIFKDNSGNNPATDESYLDSTINREIKSAQRVGLIEQDKDGNLFVPIGINHDVLDAVNETAKELIPRKEAGTDTALGLARFDLTDLSTEKLDTLKAAVEKTNLINNVAVNIVSFNSDFAEKHGDNLLTIIDNLRPDQIPVIINATQEELSLIPALQEKITAGALHVEKVNPNSSAAEQFKEMFKNQDYVGLKGTIDDLRKGIREGNVLI